MKAFTREVRAETLALPECDQADYLLEVVDQLAPGDEDHHQIDDLGLHLTRSERVIVMDLIDLAPRVCSRERLASVLRPVSKAEEPDNKTVDVLICKARKKLRPLGIQIENVWGRGWFITGWPVREENGGGFLAAR